MKITDQTVNILRFLKVGQLVRKSVPTYFKYATEEDVNRGFVSPGIDKAPTPGIIETLEGPDDFELGDVVCKGYILHEYWKLTKKRFVELKITVLEPTGNDWGLCKNKNVARAIKIPFSFTIVQEDGRPLTTKPGDYLLFDENGYWPLKNNLFSSTYEKVLE